MVERSVRFTDDQYEILKEIADMCGMPISYIVRVAIADVIDKYLNEGFDPLRAPEKLDVVE